MKPDEYVKLAVKTENKDFESIRGRINYRNVIRLQHASMGMITEVGEFTDALKKHLIYGKEADITNLSEEIGDLLWYVALACDTLGISLEIVMENNIAKLKARYGDKFNEEGAINRNLDNEKKVLKAGTIIHFMRGENTACNKNLLSVDNATDYIPAINCKDCLDAIKVNYE